MNHLSNFNKQPLILFVLNGSFRWTIYYLNSDFKFLASSLPLEVFLGHGVLKIYIKFTGEQSCQSVATLLQLFGIGVLLSICCIFWEHLFLKTPPDGCFWIYWDSDLWDMIQNNCLILLFSFQKICIHENWKNQNYI